MVTELNDINLNIVMRRSLKTRKSMGFRPGELHLPAARPWIDYLTSLKLAFFICKVRTLPVTSQVVMRIKSYYSRCVQPASWNQFPDSTQVIPNGNC